MNLKTKITSVREIAENSWAVEVEKPEGYEFKAGQFVSLGLIDKATDDPKKNFRWFSIASAPFEHDILFIFRISDSIYKQTLITMKPGDPVEISDPKGVFFLPDVLDKEIVFLAGGVGITPIRSMIAQVHHDKTPHKMHLFYSNWTPEQTVFYDELMKMDCEECHAALSMNDMSKSKHEWDGETDFINADMVHKYVEGDLAEKMFYIVGPPVFIKAMTEFLAKENVPKENMLLEAF